MSITTYREAPLTDKSYFLPSSLQNSYVEMLWAHKSLSISYVALFVLYFLGIGEKYNADQMYPSFTVIAQCMLNGCNPMDLVCIEMGVSLVLVCMHLERVSLCVLDICH